MKASKELVWALRRAAKRILDPAEGYTWTDVTRCNCGLLVREIMGYSAEEMYDKFASSNNSKGTWTTAAPFLCNATGLPFEEVWNTLKELGFEEEDFELIEWAGGGKYNCFSHIEYDSATYVSEFFLQLANELEAQLPGSPETRSQDLLTAKGCDDLPRRNGTLDAVNLSNKVENKTA